MEVLTILEWLLAWGMLLFAQSVFINGVYQSATGETKKRVDGTDDDSEMILYPLKKFFEKEKVRFIDYKNGYLANLFNKIRTDYSGIYSKDYKVHKDHIEALSDESYAFFKSNIGSMREKYGIDIFLYKGDSFYLVKPESYYIKSKWLRKPIIQCIKCMPSFWGALTFWPIVLFIFGFYWLEIPIFFADMFSLTYINWILYKKAQ